MDNITVLLSSTIGNITVSLVQMGNSYIVCEHDDTQPGTHADVRHAENIGIEGSLERATAVYNSLIP
jgi:hypothetical protein